MIGQQCTYSFTNYYAGSYRFGFNGQEKDQEIYNNQSTMTAEFWEYDGRIGRRWNIEPLTSKYPNWSPYCVYQDNPILHNDPNGEDLVKVTVPANSKGTKTQTILCDDQIADKVYAFAWKMNKEYGLVINSSFRPFEKQEKLYNDYMSGKSEYPAAKPGTSNHEGGFGFDFNVKSIGIKKVKGVYSKEAKEKMQKLSETAKEFGFEYLGAFDPVHFSINPVKGGYYDKKHDDIKTNAKYYDDNKNNIPTYNPNANATELNLKINMSNYTFEADALKVDMPKPTNQQLYPINK